VATTLARLGRWAFRRHYSVIAAWVVLIAIVGAAAAMFSGPTDNKFTLPGTESQQAIDTLSARFPAASGSSGHRRDAGAGRIPRGRAGALRREDG